MDNALKPNNRKQSTRYRSRSNRSKNDDPEQRSRASATLALKKQIGTMRGHGGQMVVMFGV